jgi:hypothetical protein
LTSLIARHKGHELSLPFVIHQEQEEVSIWPESRQGIKAMIFQSSFSTKNRNQGSVTGSLTSLIARYKGHNLLLLFFLYLQEKRDSVAGSLTRLIAR